ncbi:MAG: adenylate/guanylate cyclase domain-containing protein [Vicinamibacterales bacterium]
MKYRTKVSLGLVALALMTNGVLLTLIYYQARNSLMTQMRTTVLSIATTTAGLLDIDRYLAIKARADEDSPAYRDVEAYLRRARDANRRQDVRLKYLYIIAQDAKNPHAAHFVVDAEEEGENKSHFGESYKSTGVSSLDFDAGQVPREFVKDQWGTWLTALAPIRDRTGKSVGLVGADINADDVRGQLRWLLLSGLASMTLSVGLAVGVAVVASRRLTRPLTVIGDAVRAVGQGELNTHVEWQSNDEFSQLATAINEMVVGLRQRENLKHTLVRYVSREVADEILASGKMAELKSERRKITVLFADVRGFTSLSESLGPEEVVSLLNEYFDRMIDAIFRYKGTLNKFLGDGFMAMFGAPVDDPYQEEHAICAALEMQKSVRELRETFQRYHVMDFHIGIGINTGVAVVGNIGCDQHMEYTAIGDTVNTASRLESKTKELGVDTLISEYTYVAVRNRFRFKKGDMLQVKGKAESIQVFSVEGALETSTPDGRDTQ